MKNYDLATLQLNSLLEGRVYDRMKGRVYTNRCLVTNAAMKIANWIIKQFMLISHIDLATLRLKSL